MLKRWPISFWTFTVEFWGDKVLRLRHILHLIRSAKSLYRKVSLAVYRRLAERQFRNIRRGQRDRCWCGGELLPFKWHASYGVCAECGCYVNRRPPLPEELNKVYSLDLYWRVRQKMKGFPPIETRADLYKSDGRLDYWLALVGRYGPAQGRVIEVGCAPGILLAELQKRGYECIGVEANGRVAEWMRCNMQVDVREGLFPGVKLPRCALFLAFDLMEHVPEPGVFVCEMARLVNPGGLAIIQTPIERYDYDHPFKARPDFFDDLEHLFLFTDKALLRLAALAQLEIVSLEDSLGSLGQICVLRKPY